MRRVSSGWLSEVEFILSEAEVTSPLEPDFDFAQSSISSNLNAIKLLKTIELTLIQDLEDLLGRKVDVATVPGLRDYFRERILNQAIPL